MRSTNRRAQSLLGRAAYNSLSPAKGRLTERIPSMQNPLARKFKYLPDVSNQSQLIIKEMNRTEDKFSKLIFKGSMISSPMIGSNPLLVPTPPPVSQNRQQHQRFSSLGVERTEPRDLRSSIEGNMKLLGERKAQTSSPVPSMNFAKTNVRKSTFDPILGCEKEHSTPQAKFSTLGARGNDSYNINGYFRHSNPSQFQVTLRSY